MIILSYWKEWYNVSIKNWIFLEAGEAKTSIDSHHAQITHAIKRYVKLGYDITSGENIEDAIKDLAGTHVAHIQPNRSQDRKSTLGTIQGITNWSEWGWPNETDDLGYIYGRALPGIKKKDDTEIVENDESSAETIDPTDPPSDTISKRMGSKRESKD
ncbi:unnamed protein product [Rhizophagus irregularis]|nr:unnamed protein product [Rhizophagus irregularis]